MAATLGRCDILRLLVQSGADIDDTGAFDDRPRESPLTNAVCCGSLEAVSILLNAGTNPNIGIPENTTKHALFIAAGSSKDKVAIAALLVEKGAELNFTSSYNGSPLHAAAGTGLPEMVQLLLDKQLQSNRELVP